MVLKSYTNFSDSQLIEHLNGNIHYQLFCDVQINPLHPLTNPKIVSAICQELADRLDIEFLQLIGVDYWKPRRRYVPCGSVACIYLWAVSAGAVEGLKDYAPKEKNDGRKRKNKGDSRP